MKKIITLFLTVALSASICSCGNVSKNENEPKNAEAIKQTETITLDNIVVDDSYREKDNSPIRAVYAFFTVTSNSENIKFDSKIDVTINETNTYNAEVLRNTLCAYAPNYYYSGYLETAYVGESKKLATTFLIPEGDLTAGKKITFSDSGIEDMNKLVVFTDDIVHVNGDDEACKVVDAKGYEEIKKKDEEASPELTQQVQSLINGRYWKAYVNPSWYNIEFSAPNNFILKTDLGENGGTYSVRNGYIFCTYDSNGVTVKIPYEIKEQGVSMDLAEAFSIK